jgi:hypothetical protein
MHNIWFFVLNHNIWYDVSMTSMIFDDSDTFKVRTEQVVNNSFASALIGNHHPYKIIPWNPSSGHRACERESVLAFLA